MRFKLLRKAIADKLKEQDNKAELFQVIMTEEGVIPKPGSQPDIFFEDIVRSLSVPGCNFMPVANDKKAMTALLVAALGVPLANELIKHYTQNILLFIDTILGALLLLQFQKGRNEHRYILCPSGKPGSVAGVIERKAEGLLLTVTVNDHRIVDRDKTDEHGAPLEVAVLGLIRLEFMLTNKGFVLVHIETDDAIVNSILTMIPVTFEAEQHFDVTDKDFQIDTLRQQVELLRQTISVPHLQPDLVDKLRDENEKLRRELQQTRQSYSTAMQENKESHTESTLVKQQLQLELNAEKEKNSLYQSRYHYFRHSRSFITAMTALKMHQADLTQDLDNFISSHQPLAIKDEAAARIKVTRVSLVKDILDNISRDYTHSAKEIMTTIESKYSTLKNGLFSPQSKKLCDDIVAIEENIQRTTYGK